MRSNDVTWKGDIAPVIGMVAVDVLGGSSKILTSMGRKFVGGHYNVYSVMRTRSRP